MTERVEFVQADHELRETLEAAARQRLRLALEKASEAAAVMCPQAVETWRADADRARVLLAVATSTSAVLRMPATRPPPAQGVEGG